MSIFNEKAIVPPKSRDSLYLICWWTLWLFFSKNAWQLLKLWQLSRDVVGVVNLIGLGSDTRWKTHSGPQNYIVTNTILQYKLFIFFLLKFIFIIWIILVVFEFFHYLGTWVNDFWKRNLLNDGKFKIYDRFITK